MQAELEAEYVEYVTARLGALRRLGYLLCGDEHRADDLVQQAITKLYERWRRARNVGHLDRYVRTILVRVFLDERRRAWSARVALTGHAPDRAAPDGPDLEQRAVLRAALSRVPRRQQAVLVLRFLCDLPVDEVAQILECSAGNVKSQTHHGLAESAPPVPPPLTRCVVDRLPVPGDAYQSLVTGGDPTGRFLVGRSYHQARSGEGNLIPGTRLEILVWDDGEPTVVDMPGWDGALNDINSSGVAVGASFGSYRGDEPQTGWVYLDGELRELAGGPAVPHAINEQGAIAGSRERAESYHTPLVWRSPEADPEELSVPGSSWTVEAWGVDVDGTVVGTGHDWDLVPDAPVYTLVWLPDGTRQQLPTPPSQDEFAASHISGGVVTGRGKTVTTGGGMETWSFGLLQYDLATGAFRELPGDGMLHGFAWSTTGWLAGSSVVSPTGLALWHDSTGVLPLPVRLPGLEELPEQDLTRHIASVSDDGRVLGGQLSSGREVPADGGQTMGVDDAAIWRCE